jgi:hypothetical protein
LATRKLSLTQKTLERDLELVDDLFSEPIRTLWGRMKPIIESDRERLNQPRIFEWFEYLYNEMNKREQKLQPKSQ